VTEATALAPARSRSPSAGSAGATWRSPPAWLWVVSFVLQTASAAALTSYTYFFIDDFIFLRQAQIERFGPGYLRSGLFEHFSPISRLLDKVLVTVDPAGFGFAHALQLAMYLAAVLAFALALRTILGNSWLAFALTLLFGQSVFLVHILNWWTATANILPCTVFSLLAIVGYLRWRETRSRWWLAASVAAFGGSLLDYETGMLFPIYLGVLVLLVLEDDLHPRNWIAVLWRERAAWACYGVLEIVALWNYYTNYYQPMPHPSIGKLVHFLELGLFEAFLPALVGIADPEAAISHHAVVIVLADLLVAFAIAATVYRRPRAWRCVVAFLIAFVVTLAPVGLNRIQQFGLGYAQQLYYHQAAQFMFLLLAAFALGARSPPRANRGLGIGWLRRRPLLAGGLAAAAIALYAVLGATSLHAIARASWEPRRAHVYLNTFRRSVRTARARSGQEPVLIDHQVPDDVIPPQFAPFNAYDQFFRLIDGHIRIDDAGPPAYVVDATGRLLPVRFAADAPGVLTRASASATDGSGAAAAGAGGAPGAACTPASRPTSRLRIPLSAPLGLARQANDLPYAARLTVRMPHGASVPVLVSGPAGTTVDSGFAHTLSGGRDSAFVPLTVRTSAQALAFDLPAGTCVTSLVLGHFVVAGPPV
jgi:hypothetical protein